MAVRYTVLMVGLQRFWIAQDWISWFRQWVPFDWCGLIGWSFQLGMVQIDSWCAGRGLVVVHFGKSFRRCFCFAGALILKGVEHAWVLLQGESGVEKGACAGVRVCAVCACARVRCMCVCGCAGVRVCV